MYNTVRMPTITWSASSVSCTHWWYWNRFLSISISTPTHPFPHPKNTTSLCFGVPGSNNPTSADNRNMFLQYMSSVYPNFCILWCICLRLFSQYGGLGSDILCDFPGSIVHGHLAIEMDSYRINDSISYSCDNGYHLVGSTHLLCDSNGTWDNPVPSCIGRYFNCLYNEFVMMTKNTVFSLQILSY